MFVITTNSFSQEFGLGEKTLEKYDFSKKISRSITLPKKLTEISGLAVNDENRLFTHNDETGTIYEIDIKTGEIIDEFQLGKKKVKKDFEGIATVKDSIFLITSSGVLYKFSYPVNQKYVKYEIIKTALSSKYNVEGLCYDKIRNVLLLACKDYAGKKMKNYKAIHTFDLNTYKMTEQPAYLIDLDTLKNNFNITKFSPSGIEMNPVTGNLFILSSSEKAIVELSANNRILSAVKLNSKYHLQPEGISFLSDLTLLISDEGKEGKGKITFITFKSSHE
jgi:uncharacterized protein YjiK